MQGKTANPPGQLDIYMNISDSLIESTTPPPPVGSLSVCGRSMDTQPLCAGVQKAKSSIHPHMAPGKDGAMSLEDFSMQLENALPKFRLAMGDDQQTLYLVKFGAQGFIESMYIKPYIHMAKSKQDQSTVALLTPEFYAVAPLSNDWITKKVDVDDYIDNQLLENAQSVLFSNIDLEIWKNLFFQDIEDALQCDIAVAAAQLDSASAAAEESKGTLSDLIRIKKQLAQANAKRLEPLLADEALETLSAPMVNTIQKWTADRLKRSLTDPFTTLIALYACDFKTANQAKCRLTTQCRTTVDGLELQSSKCSSLTDENIFCVYAKIDSQKKNLEPPRIAIQVTEIEYDIQDVTSKGTKAPAG
ncbi:MAG: hypothetical protein ACLSAP_02820 [Oscillospiraceae bacterium]